MLSTSHHTIVLAWLLTLGVTLNIADAAKRASAPPPTQEQIEQANRFAEQFRAQRWWQYQMQPGAPGVPVPEGYLADPMVPRSEQAPPDGYYYPYWAPPPIYRPWPYHHPYKPHPWYWMPYGYAPIPPYPYPIPRFGLTPPRPSPEKHEEQHDD